MIRREFIGSERLFERYENMSHCLRNSMLLRKKKMRRIFTLSAISLASATMISAAELNSETYICDHGAQVLANYINTDNSSFAILAFEGRQMAFEVTQSASGARYMSGGGDWVWWTKGNDASLSYFRGASEVIVYQMCKTMPSSSR
ncbi:MliC family protein [Phaeobacter inhibens]|uniref:MliC family protein n=1 Tax=Phaeobacter inhibens TaxID=221822 RepID=UPI000C9CB38C|nr:MliC family protein [Phaeobacter inhibens]